MLRMYFWNTLFTQCEIRYGNNEDIKEQNICEKFQSLKLWINAFLLILK